MLATKEKYTRRVAQLKNVERCILDNPYADDRHNRLCKTTAAIDAYAHALEFVGGKSNDHSWAKPCSMDEYLVHFKSECDTMIQELKGHSEYLTDHSRLGGHVELEVIRNNTSLIGKINGLKHVYDT
jgi:hypothetical protein